MRIAYISVGANPGDRADTIARALRMLDEVPGIRLLRASALIETDPVGPPQPRNLNGAVAVETALDARELLDALLAIERSLGRTRDPGCRNGPRTIDLDLVLHGDAVIEEQGLSVPHPRMGDRAFVLVPLAEIAPDAVNPRTGATVASMLTALLAAR